MGLQVQIVVLRFISINEVLFLFLMSLPSFNISCTLALAHPFSFSARYCHLLIIFQQSLFHFLLTVRDFCVLLFAMSSFISIILRVLFAHSFSFCSASVRLIFLIFFVYFPHFLCLSLTHALVVHHSIFLYANLSTWINGNANICLCTRIKINIGICLLKVSIQVYSM